MMVNMNIGDRSVFKKYIRSAFVIAAICVPRILRSANGMRFVFREAKQVWVLRNHQGFASCASCTPSRFILTIACSFTCRINARHRGIGR